MKGSNIVQILEQVADNLFEPDPYLQSGGDMVRVGGLQYTIAPNKPLGERVSDIRLIKNGKALDLEASYAVSGWGVVGAYPDGRLIWDVARDYILNNKDKNNIFHLGDINHPTIVGMSDNEGVEDYAGKLI